MAVVNQRFCRDCGVACVATVTGLSWEDVYTKWPGGFHGDISDSYIHHQEILRRLNFAFERLTVDQIIKGAGVPEKVAMLLNASDDPETWKREDMLNLHWCAFAGREEGKILIHWLNGTVKTFNHAAIRKHFANPFCVCYQAYPISRIEKLPWHKRLYIRVTSWFDKELY